MSDNSYAVYVRSCLQLAQTIIIKSEYVATRTNDRLLAYRNFTADPDLPDTWKYYMNLAGEYHSTDTMMQVVSSDNLQVIDFTPENLSVHRNTSRDYQFGTRQYGELLNKYPTQEDIILGVLYPVDKAAALAAKDHTILGYPTGAIEPNEYSLVESLQNWIHLYFKRYYNDQYTVSDSMYYGTAWSMCGMNLIPAIMTERLKRHKTVEAHSFYVKQYLSSNSDLGQYYDFMTLEQQMHFYRNIRYYQRHAGSNDTLMRLIDILLTKRKIPISGYTMKHDTSTQTTDIYPQVTFDRQDITSIASVGATEYSTTTGMLTKEEPLAPENVDEIAYSETLIEQSFKDSPSNIVETKILESTMMDFSQAQSYKLEDIQVAHWLYYAHLGFYNSIIDVVNPVTGESILLNAKDAYIFALYCLFMQYNYEPTTIPLVAAQRIQRYPIPSDADVQSILDMKYVDSFALGAVKSQMQEARQMVSIDAFQAACKQIYKSANYQANLIAYQEGMQDRSEVFKMVDRYYGDEYIWLMPEGATFQNWLAGQNLKLDGLTPAQFGDLFNSLVSVATGNSLNTTPSLRNIQKAMINALMQLSSYSIQVVAEIADAETIMLDLPSVRIGDQKLDASSHQYMVVGDEVVISESVSANLTETMDCDIFTDIISHEISGRTRLFMSLQNGPHAPARGAEYYHFWPQSRIEFSVPNKPDVSGTPLQPLLGMNYFMSLSEEQKATLFD